MVRTTGKTTNGTGRRIRSIAFFCLRFAILIPVCLWLWTFVLPGYAWCLGWSGVPALRVGFRVPVEDMTVEKAGKLNIGTTLTYTVEGKPRPIEVAPAISNIPPFVALVLVTGGLRWRRRLAALGIGLAILVLTHLLYIVLALAFSSAVQDAPQVATALAQLFITLPFVLWLVLARWDALKEAFAATAKE